MHGGKQGDGASCELYMSYCPCMFDAAAAAALLSHANKQQIGEMQCTSQESRLSCVQIKSATVNDQNSKDMS